MSYKKQHIVSQTYLKYFSTENNGQGIKVLHLNDCYKKTIKPYNSGDKVFWSENYYDTKEYQDPKTIEKFLGQKIENGYNKLIERIKTQNQIIDNDFRLSIFQWVFYSKLRSPSWRSFIKYLVKEKGAGSDINSKEIREEHMQLFSNAELLDSLIKYYNDSLIAKKWRILKSPENYNWITTDNPGFAVESKDFAAKTSEYIPNPLWTGIGNYTILYFPLTKNFCLEICPYDQSDDVTRNFGNDKLEYIDSKIETTKLINNWSVLTANNIIISCNERELKVYEEKIKNCN